MKSIPQAVELDDVSKSFGPVVAVAGVSLVAGRGAFVSLLGPSGCGKTTTLRMIAGFEAPDAGAIRIGGIDVTAVPPNRRAVNTVFQHYALFPHLSVEENVAFGLKQRRLRKDEMRARLDRALDVVHLSDLRARMPRQLSGGQQQRVALARALVNEPTALLLDEPLAALDQGLRAAMQAELKKIQRDLGITFVYVTHDQTEALALSDRIAVMNRGRIVQEGTPEEIYERPASRFVAGFIGQTNLFAGHIVEAGTVTVVRCGDGAVLRCAASPRARVGAPALVAVRPEKIVPANASGANRIDGRVVQRTYLGDVERYEIECADGSRITAQRHVDAALRWDVGAMVGISFLPDAAQMIEDDEEHA